MTTLISLKDLQDKCKRFILADPTDEALDYLIRDAIITSIRELTEIDSLPLAWLRERFDEIFTRTYAEISAITQADPGVITAESMDPDISSDHGFYTGDYGLIVGVDGMDELNNRIFHLTRASATTITLKQINEQDAISTSGYDEYVSGGYIYHIGIKIDLSNIVTANSWTLKDIFDVTFDLNPAHPIIEGAVHSERKWLTPSSRPTRWRYDRRSNTTFASANIIDRLFWYPPSPNRYNVGINFEKSYPDPSISDGFTTSAYPYHIPEVHDFIWHRALANLATNAERQRRETKGTDKESGRLMGSIEVLYANMWQQKKLEDEERIIAINRKMLGEKPSSRGFSA